MNVKYVELIKENEKEILKKYESGVSLAKLEKEFGIGRSSLHYYFKKKGYIFRENTPQNRRKWKVNEHYFDEINTSNKAYILGFLYSDGYNNHITKSVVLDLKEDDAEILEKIKAEMECEIPLYYYNYVKNDGVERRMCRLTINSKIMHEKLVELGMPNNKTFSIQFPDWMDDNLKSHFIRGYFDGDGCISFNKTSNSCFVTMVSSKILCEGLTKYLNSNGLNFHLNKFIGHNENNGLVRTSSRKTIKSFYDFIYKDADLKLNRKYQKFHKFFEEFKI